MSDHEDAIAAGVEAWHAVESPRQNVQRIVAAYHAALVPDGSEAVIVLRGGDVVALDAAVTELVLDTGVDVSTEELLDAALRVAEGEA